MAEIVTMPKMSDTMTEGVIAAWHKKVGDSVESGELMAEIETDKATMEYESFNDGVVLYLGAKEGEAVAVDGLLAIVGEKGEDYKSLLEGFSGGSQATASEGGSSAEESAPAETAVAEKEEIDTSGINAQVVTMPKMSDTMTEGVIANWLFKVGDTVKEGDILAEVETDKATMEMDNYHDGVLLYIGAEAGNAIPVDGVMAIIGEKGADWETLLKAEQQKNEAPAKKEEPAKEPEKETKGASTSSQPAKAPSTNGKSSGSADGRVKASPLAKKLAEELGYDIAQINGSGPNGRVIKSDVEEFTPTTSAAGSFGTAVVGQESFEDIPASQMRKAITRGLTASQFGAPHFYLTMEIDMDKAMEARKSINEMAPTKISFNDLVVKAVATALRQHPQVNSSWIEDTASIRMNHHISVGVAMAIEDGLVVPVVKFADNKSLAAISAEVKEFAGKAKDKKLSMDEMQGNTFTVSNLGMFGIEEFTSIINAPESCILAVGGIKQTPVVKDGEIVPGNIMKVTLTCDHRTVDGATGAAFLKTLKDLLEDPVRILI